MAGYFIAAYDVSDPEAYAQYNPGGMPILMKTMMRHGGKPLVAGPGAEWSAGERNAVVVIEFPDTDAAHAWLNDPEYVPLKAIRHAATTNRIEIVAPTFVMPGG
ncbi:MAG: DUF1330 domain-containing protein [Deltaproteobacteria bacterium]|nr:DUF1330 domain-containing protein [Deltaproteobacteria bacterium]